MRELSVHTFLSLDGVMQAPGGPQEDPSGGFAFGGWTAPFSTDELGASIVEAFAKAEDFLLGRLTYELFADYWPRAPQEGDPISTGLNTLPKHVASRTLRTTQWQASSLIEGDVVDAVRALTSTDGGQLQVHGSAGLLQTLFAHDLVDELRLMTFPVVLGTGKRLFASGTFPGAWRLVDSWTTTTGVVVTTYHRDGEIRTGSFDLEE